MAAITDQPGLLPGMLYDSAFTKDLVPVTNAEASAAIPCGRFVKQGTADHDVLLPNATTNLLKGVSTFGQGYSPFVQLDANGAYLPGITFDVARHGRLAVQAGAAMTASDHVHVQVVADAGYPVGVIRPDGSAGKSVDVSAFCKVYESGDATNAPILEIDMSNAGLAVADA